MILDGSGSMHSVQDEVVEGVNNFIEEQQNNGGDTVFSLTVFDDKVKQVYMAEDIDLVKSIDESVTYMGGTTALLDAIGRTLTKADKENLKGKKLGVIYTDGMENASSEFDEKDIKAMIERLEGQGDWTFIYMSADVDSFDYAKSLGVATGNYAMVASANTGATMSSISKSTQDFQNQQQMSTPTYFADTDEAADWSEAKIGKKK